MRLPSNMRDAVFSVAEAAEMAGITETRLRDWLARNPIAPIGSKPKGRIWFDGWEVVVIAVMRDLVSGGYTPHAAMAEAFAVAGGPMPRAPNPDAVAVVGLEDDADFIGRVGSWAECQGAPRTAIVVPLGAIYGDIAAKVAARDGAA